jgi:hypothetical protein
MEKARGIYKNMPPLDARLQAELDRINGKLDLVNAATTLFDGFGIVVVGYGIYKQVTGEDASAEREVGDVIAKYRAELGGLRSKYENEKEDFLQSQRKKLESA